MTYSQLLYSKKYISLYTWSRSTSMYFQESRPLIHTAVGYTALTNVGERLLSFVAVPTVVNTFFSYLFF